MCGKRLDKIFEVGHNESSNELSNLSGFCFRELPLVNIITAPLPHLSFPERYTNLIPRLFSSGSSPAQLRPRIVSCLFIQITLPVPFSPFVVAHDPPKPTPAFSFIVAVLLNPLALFLHDRDASLSKENWRTVSLSLVLFPSSRIEEHKIEFYLSTHETQPTVFKIALLNSNLLSQNASICPSIKRNSPFKQNYTLYKFQKLISTTFVSNYCVVKKCYL